jgi:protein SCO1/2
MRTLRIALWVAVAVALFVLGAVTVGGFGWRDRDTLQAAPGTGTALGGAFALIDQRGEPVTEAVFRGKPTAAFFGYTHCPDVCPTTLMDMTEWMKALGSDVDKLRFVFVTVDPERDTPTIMNDYVSAFSDKIVGISGDPDKVHAMVKDYKIFSRKVPSEGGDYSMDHTASVILLDKDGAMVGTIDRQEAKETAVAKLRRLVAG